MPSRSIALISRHCLTIPEASTFLFFFFNDTATTEIYTLSLLDALPISPTWGRQLYRTYATIGNHDYGLGNANGTWDYFGTAAGPRGAGYYSFDMGSWHVVVLNSNYTFVPTAAGSAQELWLKSDLAAASGKCILAVWHHPRFYSSTTSPLSAGTATLPFWNDLYAAHADVIVNGHMHDYERFAQTDPSGNLDLANGIRERSEEHTSELQSQSNLVCRLLLEKKKSELTR